MSILYKYHISPLCGRQRSSRRRWCRSFISIIFPVWHLERDGSLPSECRSFISIIFPSVRKSSKNRRKIMSVSILYKYHISQPPPFFKRMFSGPIVSILYKYHISLEKELICQTRCFGCRSFISIIFPLVNIAHFDYRVLKYYDF